MNTASLHFVIFCFCSAFSFLFTLGCMFITSSFSRFTHRSLLPAFIPPSAPAHRSTKATCQNGYRGPRRWQMKCILCYLLMTPSGRNPTGPLCPTLHHVHAAVLPISAPQIGRDPIPCIPGFPFPVLIVRQECQLLLSNRHPVGFLDFNLSNLQLFSFRSLVVSCGGAQYLRRSIFFVFNNAQLHNSQCPQPLMLLAFTFQIPTCSAIPPFFPFQVRYPQFSAHINIVIPRVQLPYFPISRNASAPTFHF